MEIKPQEVQSIQVIGKLNGQDVQLIKTHGGYNIAVGMKKRNGKKAEVLAAGSHSGLVKFHLEKEYKADYEPALMKSENEEECGQITDKTQSLTQEMISKGLELFTINKNNQMDLIVTKYGLGLLKYEIDLDTKTLNKPLLNKDIVGAAELFKTKEFAQILAKVVNEKSKGNK